MSNRLTAKLAKQVPNEIRELLGDPPLVLGESDVAYWGMIASFAKFIPPDDFIAWTLIKDLADDRVEIQRYRKYKAELVTEPRRREIRNEIDGWRKKITEEPALLRQTAAKRKEELAKSGKTPTEIKKLSTKIDQQVEVECQAAEARARGKVEAWIRTETGDSDVAVLYKQWLQPVELIDPHLLAAEKKSKETRLELERHLRGLGSLIWDALDTKVIDSTLCQPNRQPARLPSPRQEKSREVNTAEPVKGPDKVHESKQVTDAREKPSRRSRLIGAVRKAFGQMA
jgi:flagellar biosynthesis GTPase FlhF